MGGVYLYGARRAAADPQDGPSYRYRSPAPFASVLVRGARGGRDVRDCDRFVGDWGQTDCLPRPGALRLAPGWRVSAVSTVVSALTTSGPSGYIVDTRGPGPVCVSRARRRATGTAAPPPRAPRHAGAAWARATRVGRARRTRSRLPDRGRRTAAARHGESRVAHRVTSLRSDRGTTLGRAVMSDIHVAADRIQGPVYK